jgi:hypothetical protein
MPSPTDALSEKIIAELLALKEPLADGLQWRDVLAFAKQAAYLIEDAAAVYALDGPGKKAVAVNVLDAVIPPLTGLPWPLSWFSGAIRKVAIGLAVDWAVGELNALFGHAFGKLAVVPVAVVNGVVVNNPLAILRINAMPRLPVIRNTEPPGLA